MTDQNPRTDAQIEATGLCPNGQWCAPGSLRVHRTSYARRVHCTECGVLVNPNEVTEYSSDGLDERVEAAAKQLATIAPKVAEAVMSLREVIGSAELLSALKKLYRQERAK